MAGKDSFRRSNQKPPEPLPPNSFPARNRAIILLSAKAGLRAGEIAKLAWEMILDAKGEIGPAIELRDHAAKKGSGQTIPIHPTLRKGLNNLKGNEHRIGPVILSERGARLNAGSVVNWFATAHRSLGLAGCSSHSGRRTFITRAARLTHLAGGSLKDESRSA
jgi:integrase/recombinase XerD